MPSFNVSKEWVILLQPDTVHVKKAAEDLSRYIGLLAGFYKDYPISSPVITDSCSSKPSEAIIVLRSEDHCLGKNGFSWRAGTDQVEIHGESGRGLCNGIYSFLAALGIGWPAPGQENLPSPGTDLRGTDLSPSPKPKTDLYPSPKPRTDLSPSPKPGTDLYPEIPLAPDKAHEPSKYDGNNPAAAPLKRFVPDDERTIKSILKKSEAFAAWAARNRYDALVFPLETFASGSTGRKLKQLKQFAWEYGISIEAGGRDLSSLVPRKYFSFHKDFFRMEQGRREKAHHFCPTNPGSIRIIGKEGGKLFRAAEGIGVFHLWPDKGAESIWCSCPTCRAFTPSEQNRIAVNAATDILSPINPGAFVTYLEKDEEGGSIPMRKNLFRLERLPDEKEITD